MRGEIFEVFAEMPADQQIIHIGSVRAPNHRLAVDMARNVYFRRQTCRQIMVTKREDLFCSDVPEEVLTKANCDKTYRMPSFFAGRLKEENINDSKV